MGAAFSSTSLARITLSPTTAAIFSTTRARAGAAAASAFNLGGLVGTLLTVPLATRLGRRPMFLIYFLASAAAVFTVYAVPMAPSTRVVAMALPGLSVFGIFAAFAFYLPELFPTRLRGTGAGFCFNVARVVEAPVLLGFGWLQSGPWHLSLAQAILLLGERLQPFHLIGYALVLAGVVIASRR